MSKLRSKLYKTARLLGDIEAIASPKKLPRRLKNKYIGRKIVSKLFKW